MKLFLTTKKVGRPPGNFASLVSQKGSENAIEVISYSNKEFHEEMITEEEISNLSKITLSKIQFTHWVISPEPFGLKELEEYSQDFQLSTMFIEDVLNPYHRPKIENTDEGIFIIIRGLFLENKKEENFALKETQICIWKFKNTVIVFCQEKLPFFNILKDRIKAGKGRIRQKKSDYLLYSILDLIVDHYYLVVSEFHKQIEKIEDLATENVSSKLLTQIHSKIDQINYIKKWVFPLKDSIILHLTQNNISIGSEKNSMHPFYKDIVDHLNQIMDTLESYKEVLVNLLNLQLTLNSYKMNQVMKTLTLISSIFIPLTFLVGVYGMNFKHMPEIDKEWAYPAFWGVSIFLSIVMLIIFKKKKFF